MAERRTVVPERTLSYSGLFDGKELYKLIKEWVMDHGYDDWIERNHTEKNTKTSKQVEIDYLPKAKVSDYLELQLGMNITYMNLKKTKIEYKGKKVEVDEGDLEINFTGFILSDYWGRWENKAHWFFIRTIMDKFVFKFIFDKYTKELNNHITELYNHIRQYLNTTKIE
ncbi:MAG: hypothetical protein ACOC32_00180 [Nanoarchaeota archaeon]